jgi:YVTN family beta-propeller protein
MHKSTTHADRINSAAKKISMGFTFKFLAEFRKELRHFLAPEFIRRATWIPLLSLFSFTHCTGTLFEEIGTHLAAPIAIAVDTANLRAYVVNSNNNIEFTSTTLSILDLTDPAAPVLLNHPANPIPIPNFSGQIYLDPVTRLAYLPNRFSENEQDDEDALLRIHLDETSGTFGTVEAFPGGENPFGIACCDASGRIYTVSSGGDGDGTLNVYNPADLSVFVQISLNFVASDGSSFTGEESTEVALLGSQAFVSNRFGNIYVINNGEVGDTSKNPIDYVVLEGGDLRGIATDGTLLYVVDGQEDEEEGLPALRVINPALMPPVDPDVSTLSEFDISAVQTASILLTADGDPNEVLVFKGKAYVTNLDANTVSVIDLATNTTTATISVGEDPFGLTAFTIGTTDYLYVANLVSDSISIIDLSTNSVVNTFSL